MANAVDTVIINPNLRLDPINDDYSETIKAANSVESSLKNEKKDESKAKSETEERIPISRKVFGIFLIFMCSIQVTAQGAIIKYIEVIPTGEAVMIVSGHAILFLAVVAGYYNISLIRFPNKKFIFMRCVIGGASYVAKIWSFRNLPFGDATALHFTIPFFAGILARFYLKEKYTLVHVLATLCGFAGIVLVAKPSFVFPSSGSYTNKWYVAVPLVTAAVMGWAYVCVRRAGTAVSTVVVSFYLVVCQFLAGFAFHSVSGTRYVGPSCYDHRALLLFCSVLSVTQYVCLNKGLAIEKSGTASLVRNCDTVLAYLVQIFIFRADVDVLSLVGAALILTGTISIALGTAFDLTCGVEF